MIQHFNLPPLTISIYIFLLSNQETDEIQYDSYARIEHVLSNTWLHALRDEEYSRKQMEGTEDDNSMRGLRWDGAHLRMVCIQTRHMTNSILSISNTNSFFPRIFYSNQIYNNPPTERLGTLHC